MAISSTSGYAASLAPSRAVRDTPPADQATNSAMREPVDRGRDLTSETIGRADEHFDGDRNVYRSSMTDG